MGVGPVTGSCQHFPMADSSVTRARTGAAPPASPLPAPWFRALRGFTDALTVDFPGGPRALKMAWVINLQKGGTLPFVLALMWWYQDWSIAAWTYAGLHGSYGLIWLLKDRCLPDPAWERQVTIGGALMMFVGVLGPYWIAPFLLISDVLGEAKPQPSAPVIGVAVLVYAIGVVLMIGADAQKYYTLRERHGLITDGFFARIRHPNYLGEMMLYASFALLVGHWIPWLVLAWVWSVVFATNIAWKEASLSRYPGWGAYKRRSGRLLPRLW
jgi:protein-S-isoprenylcysteine O-methyltransferase Ste14